MDFLSCSAFTSYSCAKSNIYHFDAGCHLQLPHRCPNASHLHPWIPPWLILLPARRWRRSALLSYQSSNVFEKPNNKPLSCRKNRSERLETIYFRHQCCYTVENYRRNREWGEAHFAFHLVPGQPTTWISSLFPSLHDIVVEDFDSPVPLFPMLVSSSTNIVHIHPPKSHVPFTSPSTRRSTLSPSPSNSFRRQLDFEAFIVHLSRSAPKLQELRIKNVPHLPSSLLDHLASNLPQLRALELQEVVDVKSFNDLRPLGSLPALEYLSLTFQPSLSSHISQIDAPLMDTFLPILTSLELIGPREVVFDFARALGSKSVKKLCLRCKSPPVTFTPGIKPVSSLYLGKDG